MANIPSTLHTLIECLDDLILDALKSQEAQRHYPDSDADKMDAIIKFEGTRVRALRDCRERIENEMARPLMTEDGQYR